MRRRRVGDVAGNASASQATAAVGQQGRADILRLPRVDAGLDLDLLLKALNEGGVRAILLEGGPTLAGSFLAAGLIDQVVAYIAPGAVPGRPIRFLVAGGLSGDTGSARRRFR
jgi:diaminohydroxyphosphoribosylaminopyrimidine deaminase/5-amino-6-(5-phosphoribosylamino)uracil reductase